MNSLKYNHSKETLTWGNEVYKAVSSTVLKNMAYSAYLQPLHEVMP